MELDRLLEGRREARRLYPRVDSGGAWQRSDFDARAFVDCYPPLRVKRGCRLVVYHNGWGGNCSTLLYALPDGAGDVTTELASDPDRLDLTALRAGPADEQPHLAWSLAAGAGRRQLVKPRPRGALASFMEAVEGNDTPLAYLQAALLVRDGAELGAAWHGSSWTTHHVLGESPFLPPEKVQHLLGLFREYLETTPLDPFDVYARLLPDGGALQKKYRQKLRRGKKPEVDADALFRQIQWTQQTLRRALDWARNIYFNDSNYSQFAGTDHPLSAELADFAGGPEISVAGWTWNEPLPTAWLGVEMSEREAVVTFHSWTALHGERLLRHVTRFQRGTYSPILEEHEVGTGRAGYMF
jgi:hypothetical protein